MLADLQLGEFIYEQPAVGDVEYTFKHALTQEVAYNSMLIERRKVLHERAGERSKRCTMRAWRTTTPISLTTMVQAGQRREGCRNIPCA